MRTPPKDTETEMDARPSMGQWARDVADTYRALSEAEGWPQRRDALATEAAKYYGIAARMDRIPRAALPVGATP